MWRGFVSRKRSQGGASASTAMGLAGWILAGGMLAGVAHPQSPPPQLPPPEPAQEMPQEKAAAQLRVTTNVVLVPTLVEKGRGQVIYGLKSGDFTLEDNGVPQKLRVEEEMDTAPVALVVAVQQGRMAGLEYDKVAKLGPLLDLFLGDGRSQAALVGFDSSPQLVRD